MQVSYISTTKISAAKMTNNNFLKKTFVCCLLALSALSAKSQDVFTAAVGGGNWTTPATWIVVRDLDNPGTSTYPGETAGSIDGADIVSVSSAPANLTVSVSSVIPNSVASITINGAGVDGFTREIVLNAGAELTVNGEVLIQGATPLNNSVTRISRLVVNDGTLNIGGDLTLRTNSTNLASTVRAQYVQVGGTTVLSGNLNLNQTGNAVRGTFNASGGVFEFGGSSNVAILNNGATIGSATLNFPTLTINKSSSSVTLPDDIALTIAAQSVTVNSAATFQVNGSDANAVTHAINVSGNLTNDGTLNLRSGATLDLANINIAGNLSGIGTSNFNNITFNGSSNQAITIGGAVTNIQAVIYNNTGAAGNDEIRNQSTIFSDALTTRQTAAGTTNISTFTNGNYIHDNTAIYIASGTGITIPLAMSVTVPQGTVRLADIVTVSANTVIAGTLTVNGGTVDIARNVTETAGAILDNNNLVTISSGTLNIGGSFTNNTAINRIDLAVGSSAVFNQAGGVVNLLPALLTSSAHPIRISSGEVNISGGVMNMGANVTDVTAGNFVQMNQINPRLNISGTGILNICAGAGFTNYGGGGALLNLIGTAGTPAALTLSDNGQLNIAPNLAFSPDLSIPGQTTREVLDIEQAGASFTMTGGTLQCGGNNRGNFRLVGNNSSFTMSGGTANITANFVMAGAVGNAKYVTVNGGTLNIGTFSSNGGNTLTFPGDAGAPNVFTVNAGTVNVGDGNSVVTVGDNDNNPAFGTGNYAGLYLNGGTFNMFGQFNLNDANARFVQTGGTFNINQGIQSPGGLADLLAFRRGIVYQTAGNIRLVDPNPTSGSGVTVLVSNAGNPSTGPSIVSGDSSGVAPITFLGTFAFGDGVSDATGSPDGFDMLLSTNHTFASFEINNPSGINRFVTLGLIGGPGTFSITGDMNLVAGEFRQGTNLVDIGNTFSVGSLGTYRISNTTGSPFPTVGSTTTLATGSTVIFDGLGDVTVTASGSTPFSNLVVAGNGFTKTISAARTINDRLTIQSGVFQTNPLTGPSTNRLTMANGSTIRIDSGAFATTPNHIIQGGNFYTVEYVGNSKSTANVEFSAGGPLKALVANLNPDQTLTLNTDRNVRNLTIDTCFFNTNNFSLGVDSNITLNSGEHIGLGRIILQTSTVHTIGGDNNGVLKALRITGPASTVNVNMTANTTIKDSIAFSASSNDRFFNVTGSRVLTFDTSGTAIGINAASPRRFIATNGLIGQGGVAKVFPGVGSFTYPISGATTKYTPATITVNTGSPGGIITVRPINARIPFATGGTDSLLQYYWRVDRTGFTTNVNATLSFTYDQTDVSVPATENLYVPALYNPAAFTTFSETQVDETNNIISFTGLNLLAGQYTAGHPNRFGTVEALYSVANGSWFDPNTWSLTPTGPPGNGGTPNNSKPVFLQGSRTVNVPLSGAASASLDITSTNDTLLIEDGTTGHDFGELTGFGTLRLVSNSVTAPTFPTAIYATFLSEDGGTVEFGGAGSYTVPTTPGGIGEYRNLAVSGSGTKTFADENVLLYGSLRVRSGTAQFSSAINGNMTIDSLLSVSTGATLQFQGTGEERSIIVGRAIVNNGNFIVDNSLTLSHALQLGGNLVNNGTLDFRNANTNCNITFSGANNATLSGTGATTEFNFLTVDKGSDTSRVLQVTASNFSLPNTTSGTNALTLVNGTFRFSGTSTSTIQLVTRTPVGVDFVIPSSARLWMDNPNAQFVITSASEKKLTLNGVLQVSEGQVNIGTSNPPPDAQSRISYESTTAAIVVSGGELNVGENIIPSTGATLRYIQSGGVVRVSRYRSFTTTTAPAQDLGLQTGDFVMSNSGGTFNMSNGALEVVRRNVGANQFGIGIHIGAGQTSSVTGGEVRVITSETNNNRPVAISSSVPFYNLVIGNGTYTGTVGNADAGTQPTLQVINDLTVNTGTGGAYTLYLAGGTTGQNNTSLTVGGNINITGGSLLFGTGAAATTLTLNGDGAGTTQLISNTGFASSITLRSLTISAGADTIRLGTTSGADLTIGNNLTLSSGTFDATTNSRRVTFSTATNINQNLAIPVTGITFYDLRINKTTGNNQVIVAGGNITVTNTLDLQDGVLNLGANGLSVTNPTSGAITGGIFGVNRRISLSGTVSDLGVTRTYPNTTTTGFVFPIGTAGLYTPATVNVTTADGTGTVTVKPISTRFPSAPAPSSLEYYWDVSVQGFGAGVQTAHTFGYVGVNLSGAEANYRGNFFNGTTWAVTPQPVPDDVDETNDSFGATINASSILNNVTGTFVNRAFTAGFNFSSPTIFYSWASGVIGGTMDWASGTNNSATSPWSSDPTVFNSTGVDGVEPSAANPVIIQNNHTVNFTVNGRTASSVTLNAGTTLNLAATTGHNFGAGISGQGTLRTESATLPTLASAFRNTGGGTVNFAGAAYNITGPQTFNNLTVSAGTKTIAGGNLTINGDLSVTSGTLNLATFSANRSSVGGALSLSAGAVLVLQGVSNFPANYTTYSLAPTSIVRYDGNANQTISSLGGQPYGDLQVLITGTATTYTKTLAGATEVAGNLTVNRTAGTGNLILATNNHNLTLAGNFSLSQADPITQFNGGTSTVTFNGAGAQTITRVGGGTLTFNNLTVNKTSGTLTLATATATTTLTVPGTLSLASGALTIGGSVAVPNTLALNGTASGVGTITGSANSNLTIGGTANAAVGTIGFTTGAQTLRDLTINKGTTNAAEVTFGSDLAVANILTLTNGRVLMSGTNTLTYNNTSASITGGNANSFIDGRLAVQFPTTGVTRVFPTGDVLNFRPVRVTTSSATAGSTVRTEMINTIPTSGSLAGMNNISGVRYYSVDLTAGSLTSPQVRLEYQPDEVVTDPNDLVVARSTDNNNWTNIGRDAANSSTSTPTGFITSNVTTIGSTTFFALGSLTSDNPLPVNMLSVNAVAKNGRTALIQWETASEQDNLGFVIYRSETENGNFEQIASYQTSDKLRGQGTRLENTKYLYEDSRNTLPGKEYFYKLVSVDIDGTRHDITLGGQRIWSVQLPFEYALDQNYPNPFNPVTTIQFSLEKAARTTLEIYNVLGQKVATLVNGELSAGAYRYQWNGSGMASGIYFYRLRSDNFVATKKMLLVK